MQKILAEIDLTKIDKKKIEKQVYTSEVTGEQVTKQILRVELVKLKVPKPIVKLDGTTSKLIKTYFVAQSPTQEERLAKAPTRFCGDGLTFTDAEDLDDIFDTM